MTGSPDIGRRQVLRRGAALAAATLGFPSILRAGALADGGPSEKINIGFIGCGRRSANLQSLPPAGATAATADPFLPRAEAVAKKLGGRPFADYRRLLDLAEVDAVVIASPDHWHALHTIHACQAGKDVFVEKPMSLTIVEGRRMVEAARKHARIVQCGSQQRSMAENRKGCEIVRNGLLGPLKEIIGANYPSPWECAFAGQPVPAGLDWDQWCGPTPVVPFHPDIFAPRTNPGWISFRPWSGGEMTGWGSHGLDQVQWALGMDASGPVEVWAEGGKFEAPTWSEPRARAEGEAICGRPQVSFRYASGVTLRLADGPQGGAIFVGEKGRLVIDRARIRTDPPEIASAALPADAIRLRVSEDHMRDWFECMRSRKLPAADVEIGHRSVTVCHLGNIARWTGRRLRWDPAREVFPDDRDANSLLDRARRRPWELPAV